MVTVNALRTAQEKRKAEHSADPRNLHRRAEADLTKALDLLEQAEIVRNEVVHLHERPRNIPRRTTMKRAPRPSSKRPR